MELLDTYVELAERLTRSSFGNRLPFLFLLKRPRAGSQQAGPITFRTQAITTTGDGLINDAGPFAEGYWVWALKKRHGNPFPDRISIGRATNCDVVFRLNHVSKLHAHVLINGEHASVIDQGSANGTWVNDVPLKPQVERALKVGDVLRFGAIDLTLLDAPSFYDVLRTEIMTGDPAASR